MYDLYRGSFSVRQSQAEGWKSTNFECTYLSVVIVYVRRNIFLTDIQW